MDFKKKLKCSGLKITPQRVAILEKICAMGHPTIEEIYEGILQDYPSISLATIYKNILALCEVGLLNEVKVNLQKQRYEISASEHTHAVCTVCGKIEDVDLKPSYLFKNEKIAKKIKPSHAFAIVYGKCPDCSG